MKNLLKNYQNLNRQQSSISEDEQLVNKSSPVNNHNSYYPIYEKIWNDHKNNTKNQQKNDIESSIILERPFNSLGLLFIIIDDLPHELIWRTWLDITNSQSSVVRIFIHAKYPERIRSPWVKSHLVSFHYFPEWGSVEITKVMISLLREAIHLDTLTHFCFVSESCLPAVSLDEAVNMIQADNTSWIKWKSQANNGYSMQDQFTPLSRSIPTECVFKADQWVLLLRHHVQEMLTLIDSLPFDPFKPYQSVRASDEMFIPTTLSLLNYVKKTEPDGKSLLFDPSEISFRRVTYCQWEISNPKNPTTYSSVISQNGSQSYNICNDAKIENCLFMRKVMNSKIKYPWNIRKQLSQKLLEMWNEREVLLRQWCEMIYHLDIGHNVEEKTSLDVETATIIRNIWTLIEIVKSDFDVLEEVENSEVTAIEAHNADSEATNKKNYRKRSFSRDRSRKNHRSRSSDRRNERQRSRSRDRYSR